MKFLRTISTRRLLATLAGLVVVIAGGAAVAVAATGSGSPPPKQSLATSLHNALSAKPVAGLSAHITFTNGLISSDNFAGGPKDPILQGASGRLYVTGNHQMRLELYSDSGDAQIVLNGRSFWISDPSMNTVYEGTLPPSATGTRDSAKGSAADGVPSIAQIQSDITRLLGRVNLSGLQTSDPTVAAGQPAYSVTVSPKHSAGLLGDIQLAWDAAHGVPLDIQVHASGNPTTAVLELRADTISYGAQPASLFTIAPPAGEKVVKIAAPSGANHSKASTKKRDVTGVTSVAAHLPFTLAAPASIEGMPRGSVKLLDYGGKSAALVTYGQNLGGVAVIEQTADAAGSPTSGSGSGSNSGTTGMGALSLPTVTITGASNRSLATGQELGTALGTVLRFTHGGVAYTVLGSVSPYVVEHAAAALIGG